MRETETAIDGSATTGDGVSSSKLLPTSDDMRYGLVRAPSDVGCNPMEHVNFFAVFG